MQAANCYKQSKDPEAAVEMYLKCVECEPDEGFKANYYRDASRAIAQTDTQKYIELSKKAIEHYRMGARASQASSVAKEVATKLEDDYNYELAIEFYALAAELYEMENATMYMNQMLAKWCDLNLLEGNFNDFAKIIKTYEKIGRRCLSENLIRSQARDYFFKSSLCYLCNDDL